MARVKRASHMLACVDGWGVHSVCVWGKSLSMRLTQQLSSPVSLTYLPIHPDHAIESNQLETIVLSSQFLLWHLFSSIVSLSICSGLFPVFGENRGTMLGIISQSVETWVRVTLYIYNGSNFDFSILTAIDSSNLVMCWIYISANMNKKKKNSHFF